MAHSIEVVSSVSRKISVTIPAEEVAAALNAEARKVGASVSLPGFRKGKAPRAMIEKMYGAGIFYEDAANEIIPRAYDAEVAACDLELVSQPKIDVEQIEKGQPFIFTAEVAVKPEVTLGVYDGVEVPKTEIVVTDEEVDAEVDKERERNSRTVDVDDRPVADGDMIKLDFDGSVDGIPFEGGKAENYDLTVGSGSFIPGFEEQLVGKNIGEDVEVKVTFPEDYHSADLAGKAAVFMCRVNEIKVKELPDADDDFAQDVSEFDTLAEYKEDIKKNLTARKEAEAKNAKETAAVDAAVANAEMDIPEAMIASQVQNMADDFTRRLQSQGLTVEQYFQFTGLTGEKLLEQMKPEALKRIQNSLVLEAIAAKENFEISEEKIAERIGEMAESYKMEADKVRELLGETGIAQMTDDLKIQAAVDFVRDHAKEV